LSIGWIQGRAPRRTGSRGLPSAKQETRSLPPEIELAAQFGFVSPPLIGFNLSTEVLIWVALGGRRALITAFLGAIAVRLAENALGDLLGPAWLLGLGLVFVLCMIFLPRGLIGEAYWRLIGRGDAR